MQHCTGNGRRKTSSNSKTELFNRILACSTFFCENPKHRDHSHATVVVLLPSTPHDGWDFTPEHGALSQWADPVWVDLMLKQEQRQLTNQKDTRKCLRHISTARSSKHQSLRGQSANMILIFTTKLKIFEAPGCKSSVTSNLWLDQNAWRRRSACASVSRPARLRWALMQ